MIESLDISNLGVIANAHVDFGPGLVVVTGETGAGKTMVLSSLQLLLGARADAALVRSGTERLSVDGIFSITPDIGSRVEDAGGLVEGDELIVGRSVRAAGRSRAHLGSRPVPAAVLADIVGSMVTIHGQSDRSDSADGGGRSTTCAGSIWWQRTWGCPGGVSRSFSRSR